MAKKRKKRKTTRKRSRPRNGNGYGSVVKTAVGGVLAITVVKGVLS